MSRINRQSLGVAACIVAGALPALTHYATVDESKNYVVEDYTRNMFDSLEPDALVISYQWDYFVSAAYYYQLVEHVRPDVAVVDKELLRRSWYFKQLEHRYPWLIENSRSEVNAFLRELDKFEHDLPYNPAVIQARFEQMVNSFFLRNLPDRPVYVTREIEPEFTRDFQRIPSGLAFRLARERPASPIRPREFSFRPIPRRDKYSDGVIGMYAAAYVNQGIYMGMSGDTTSALRSLRKAVELKPDHAEAQMWLRRLAPQR